MACHKEPPFTAEQVTWIDQRIAGASHCLAGDLVDQGARDRDAHGARGEVKGAAVHEGVDTHAA